MKRLVLSILALSMLIGFSGCGSSDDSESASGNSNETITKTGTFIDAPVYGISYETATQNGFTNDKGEFKYVAGETVEFKLGNLSLGTVSARSLITPYTLAGGEDINAPSAKATNIAMLLQSFDGDRSDSEILNLTKLQSYTSFDIDLNSTTDDMFNKLNDILTTGNFVGEYADGNTTAVNATTANNTMKSYIQANSLKYDKKFTHAYLNGKTFYSEFIGFNEPIDTISFNLDQQTSFLDENENPSVTRTDAYQAMDGMIRIFDGKIYEYTTENNHYNDGINIYTIITVDDDKIICSVQIPGQAITVNFYFNNPN